VHADSHILLTALRHPLRRQILRAMSGGEATSPRELAERLDQPLGNLSYHVRVLARCGALELVDEKRVRGTTQHFYRASVTTEWAQSLLQEAGGQSPGGGT